MEKHSGFEILSPAGSPDVLRAAVANGADAVYIGGQNFSARKNAENFSSSEIYDAIAFAHVHGVKVYAAVNTLIHDSELEEAFEFVRFLYEAGADALIIQDLGLMNLIQRFFPDFHIHASTQMTIHSLEGARRAERLGFSRAVLSRELTLDEIKNISRNCKIELEVFVHGALCMSYSGQCLMSSFLGCRSGNRGACAQPCRLPYSLSDFSGRRLAENRYLLSLKDLCLIDEMDALADCGVTSLKIEGRMKSAEYVSVVTHMYNKYRHGGRVLPEDMAALENIFSRSGFTKGYLTGSTGRDMLNFSKSNDSVYSDIDKSTLELADRLKKRRAEKIKVDISVRTELGKCAEARFTAGGVTVEATGDAIAEPAHTLPLTGDRIFAQMSKTGNTPFELSGFNAETDGRASLPVKEINELRRRGLELLADKLSRRREKSEAVYEIEKAARALRGKIQMRAEVRTLGQAEAAIAAGFDMVLAPYILYSEHKEYFDNLGSAAAVILPAVERDNLTYAENIDTAEVCISNISQLGRFNSKKISVNYTMNVFNSLALRELAALGAELVCLSPELNIRQISQVEDFAEKELVVYGRVPLMTVQNCVVKSASGRCGCTDRAYTLTDRRGAGFPLFADRLGCTNTIYNSVPIYMADRLGEIPTGGAAAFRFIFTVETPREIAQIFGEYKNKKSCVREFTRGHYYRGV